MRAHSAASTVSLFLIGFLCGTQKARAALDTTRPQSTQRGGLTCVVLLLGFSVADQRPLGEQEGAPHHALKVHAGLTAIPASEA